MYTPSSCYTSEIQYVPLGNSLCPIESDVRTTHSKETFTRTVPILSLITVLLGGLNTSKHKPREHCQVKYFYAIIHSYSYSYAKIIFKTPSYI